MFHIETAIKTPTALRGVIYLQDLQTGKYDDEIGEADIFNREADTFVVYLYLTDQFKDGIRLSNGQVVDKLLLAERLKTFIGENFFVTGATKLEMNVSFLSATPSLDYQC